MTVFHNYIKVNIFMAFKLWPLKPNNFYVTRVIFLTDIHRNIDNPSKLAKTKHILTLHE